MLDFSMIFVMLITFNEEKIINHKQNKFSSENIGCAFITSKISVHPVPRGLKLFLFDSSLFFVNQTIHL